jgi:hypothetical protein
MDVMSEALFDVLERAQVLGTKSPPTDRATELLRIQAIGAAGADFEKLATAMLIIQRSRRTPQA